MTVKITWLGHACVQLEYEGKVIIVDPWIENPKFPGDDFKPKKIDLMLITHGHSDHFGNAIELAKEFNPQIPVIYEMSLYLESKGVENVSGFNFGGVYDFEGIKVALVPSSHSGGRNEDGTVLYLGSAAGYVIAFPDGNIFYHCGDSGVTAEMQVISELYAPNIGLLSAGGFYTMGSRGVAHTAKMMGLKYVVPIHWGTFPPLSDDAPNKIRAKLDGTGTEVIGLNPGDAHEFGPVDESQSYKSFYS
ncbi:MAG: metal-dependent hydrolase [Candidatus Heimdallarchaeota archaeon]|nr:metal-dependent hydrolase [Candidatus Heimdallarchaeota archaeon]